MAIDLTTTLSQSTDGVSSKLNVRRGVVFDQYNASESRVELSRVLGSVRLQYCVYNSDLKTVYVYGLVSASLERSEEVITDVDLGSLF